MTRAEQMKLVSDITNRIANKVIDQIESGAIPARWSGIELRQHLTDKFSEESDTRNGLYGKSKAEFKNDVIVYNL